MQSFANTGISDESSDSPAARGPVAQQPAGSEARAVFCSVFTYEAVLPDCVPTLKWKSQPVEIF
jgi:hypothetical protein